MQLDLCIRSLKKHFKEFETAETTVIYTASSDGFAEGYDKVVERYTQPGTGFVKQTTFRQNTLNAISFWREYTMFLVDDVVFKEDFSLADPAVQLLRSNEQMLALSLRLHRGANYCYALNQNMTVPRFERDVKDAFLMWKYRGCDGDWGYGLSVDGNIYNTKFILWILDKLDFHNPNSLEAQLNSPVVTTGIRPMYLCCYDGPSKLLNVPANRVQDEFPNRNEGNHRPDVLNMRFLDGEQISLKNITGCQNFSVHYPIDYVFEKD